MTDIHNDTAPTDTAPTADGSAPAVDPKHTDAAVKKEKMQLLKKLKAIIKKCLPASKKEKHHHHAGTTEEEPAADAPEDPAAPEPAPLEA